MTRWSVRRVTVGSILTMWQVFRVVDGVEEIAGHNYAIQEDAVNLMRALNAQEKALEQRQPL